jgi:cell fate regulator YaaT (PSP1 superfamily)
MGNVVQVRLGEYRPVCFFETNGVTCVRGDMVILEMDRTSEFGEVLSEHDAAVDLKNEKPRGKLIRRATEGDLRQIANNRQKAQEGMQACVRNITERKLDMQMIKAEYTFDGSKVLFYFTAEGRIDFRALVKDLARVFCVRIELKQIGVRDKAKMVSGFGVCGRELCCASYMTCFHPLSIKMAKTQGLPLNPSRISGSCGRIKCCMSYEFIVYKEEGRDMPHVGEKVTTPDGKGKVIDVNLLKRTGLVDIGDGRIVKMEFPKKERGGAPIVIEKDDLEGPDDIGALEKDSI